MKDYGAVGAGGVDDTTAIRNCLGDATTGGIIFFPSGTYTVLGTIGRPTVDGLTFQGAGWQTTSITRGADVIIFDLGGSGSGSHRSYITVENMTIDGGGAANLTQLVRAYYANFLRFQNLKLTNTGGIEIEGVELWDSRIRGCWFDAAGLALGANSEALRLVSTKEGVGVGGYGYSTDSVNNIWAEDLEFTANRQGDFNIARNGGSNNPHRMYFQRVKQENAHVRNNQYAINLETLVYSAFRDFSLHPSAFDAGQSTPIKNVQMVNVSDTVFDNWLLENGAASISHSLFFCGGVSACEFHDMQRQGTVCTDAEFFWNGANAGAGIRFTGYQLNIAHDNGTGAGNLALGPIASRALVVNSYTGATTLWAGGNDVALFNATGGPIAVTLPPAVGSGIIFRCKKTDASANAVTISRAGADTIEGVTSVALAAQYNMVTLIDIAAGLWGRF